MESVEISTENLQACYQEPLVAHVVGLNATGIPGRSKMHARSVSRAFKVSSYSS